MIRFTNTTGDHNKFWSISVMVDSTHNRAVGYSTRWGKIDTRAQSKDKCMPAHQVTTAAIELISSKIRKGYQYEMATIQNGPEQALHEILARRGYVHTSLTGEPWANTAPIEYNVARNIARTEEAIRRAYEQTHQPVEEKSIEEILADKEMDRFSDLLE